MRIVAATLSSHSAIARLEEVRTVWVSTIIMTSSRGCHGLHGDAGFQTVFDVVVKIRTHA